MYIIPIAWLYVVILMSAAEATAPNGPVLGASITLLLYGVLPVGLLWYLMGTPARRRAIRASEAAERLATPQAQLLQPNTGSVATGDAIPAVRKEP